MPRLLRIALCQFRSIQPSEYEDNVARNIERAKGFVAEAAARGAKLLVFPEFWLSGIMAEDLHLAEEAGHYEEGLCAAAKEHSIDIVAGSIVERYTQRNDNLYNTAYYVSARGEVLHRYRKRNLWHPEKDYLTPGMRQPQTFQTDRFKAGMAICWDLAWPETFRALMREGAEVIIVPTYWTVEDLGELGRKHDPNGEAEKAFIDSLVIARAYESNACVVFVNTGGPAEQGFIGRSAVAMPLKGVVARMDDPAEELRIVDVDLDVLQDADKVYRIREDYDANRS